MESTPEETTDLSTVSNLPSCSFCKEHVPHDRFVYLMRDSRRDLQTADAYIGKSRLPLHRILQHNRDKLLRVGAKQTRANAPYWTLVYCVGPFPTGATEFKEIWRKSARTLPRRVAFGIDLARSRQQQVWFADDETAQAAYSLIDSLKVDTKHEII